MGKENILEVCQSHLENIKSKLEHHKLTKQKLTLMVS